MPLHLAHPLKTIYGQPFQRPQPLALSDIAARVPRPDLRPQNAPAALCDHGQLTVYLAGSDALSGIATRLGVYLVKIGVTGGSPPARIRQLGAVAYCGLWGRPGDLREVPQARSWRQFRLSQVPRTSRDFVSVNQYGDIQLSLPPSLDRALVDAAITTILQPRSLTSFFESLEGQIRCQQANVDPQARFWTSYPNRAPAMAREVFLIDPRRDGAMLLDVLDSLGRHLASEI